MTETALGKIPTEGQRASFQYAAPPGTSDLTIERRSIVRVPVAEYKQPETIGWITSTPPTCRPGLIDLKKAAVALQQPLFTGLTQPLIQSVPTRGFQPQDRMMEG